MLQRYATKHDWAVHFCCLLQVPADYDATYQHFAAQGARVIALAPLRNYKSCGVLEC
jgi:hypothetical protein